ncbi:MAG TPA: hypothetical protein VM934_09910 [Pyrinomonadaceae bacterium]|jgi:hypothetical protein|nr:hypothetical protein [Pyrinomonadaceae bacterium]
MKVRRFKVALAIVAVCASSLISVGARAQSAEAPLTNASVVKLARAGFREKTVIAIINARPTRFDLSPERLIELKKAGVSERIILAMLAREGAAGFAGEDFDGEGFFDGTDAPGSRRRAEPGEVGIFGSSGGSRGRTQTRGGSGGSDGETQTTGSATVRILRPPTEAGGAAPLKLEKTPTLTNDSVVELVEAGFTEGTIIRRIEQSPADFDLAPSKLAELRKRRVTEPVIAAMRSAMGDEAVQPVRPEK